MGKTQSIEMSAPTNTNELFCSYAALLLSDCEQDVTEDGINAVVKAAGGSVPASYAAIFAKVAGIKSVSSLVELASAVGGGGGGGGGGAADAGAAAPAAAAEKKKSSSDDGGGGGAMFADEDY